MDIRFLKEFLDEKVDLYNRPAFIEVDPISIPHQFSKKEDIEISGFLVASIAWGNRKSILANGQRLMNLMDGSPFEFVKNHSEQDLEKLEKFVHRTFNSKDLVFFVKSLQNIYAKHQGLSSVFERASRHESVNLKASIAHFRSIFFEISHPARTKKHVSNPMDGSASKRLNMFLRWMVRKDKRKVDFGIWDISPSLLSCPLDVHSGKVARELGILKRKQNDWTAVEELDAVLRGFDAEDPVKYDFALFGLSANPGWK